MATKLNPIAFKDAGMTSHYIFQELLKDPLIFKAILEELLQREVGEIERIIRDPKLAGNLYSHDIVCDVLAFLENGTLINLELQNRDMVNFLKRTRYYVSQLQVNYYSKDLEEKRLYDGVPQVISIWLCTFPKFRYGGNRNTIVSYNYEMGMIVEDGVLRIFVDITKLDSFSSKLQELFRFILDSSEENGLQANWDIVRLLYRKMMVLKEDPRKENEYMTYNKAHEVGYEEGRIEEQIKMIKNMSLANIPVAQIAEIAKLSMEEVQRIIEEPMVV